MFQLRRVTKDPGTALRVMVDEPSDGDGGFGMGGTFYFAPAGEDGDTHQVSRHTATVILQDGGLAKHFVCVPPLDGPKANDKADRDPAPRKPAK